MSYRPSVIVIALSCVLLPLLASSAARANDERFDVRATFDRLCATCHGRDGSGGSAPSMLRPEELKRPSDEAMYDIIARGNDEAGMPGYAKTMTAAQIRALVVYIRELRERHARGELERPTPDRAGLIQTRHHDFRFETLLDEDAGLDEPWSLAILPDGAMLIADKPGPVRLVHPDGRLHPEPLANTPAVFSNGQGGMLEVALHPDYATSGRDGHGWVYLAYSDLKRRDGRDVSMTKVVRAKLDRDAHAFTDFETIYQADPEHYWPTRHHFGVRLVFRGGHVYFPVGDRGRQNTAQDLTLPAGKVHRVREDGQIPSDNPFAHSEDGLATIYTYGNRNPQGLSLHPETGELWSTEHGPRGGDELNVLTAGTNYGWPKTTFGINYNGTPVTHRTHADGVTPPIHHWTPSIAVCGTDFVVGDAFPNWEYDLLVTALVRQELRRLRLGIDETGAAVVLEEETLIADQGRIRDVPVADDGTIYVIFNRPGRIVRLTPAR
ncbi:MAG: PQQ-dependent sugar dehydrogenase [Planctomycetota bacterium]